MKAIPCAMLLLAVIGLCMAGLAVLSCYLRALVLAKRYPFSAIYETRKAAEDYVCADKISPSLLQYAVWLEDQHFYQHPGYDPVAIKHAIRINLRSRSLQYGASTITQQLIKNLYFSFRKSLFRKGTEIFLAAMLEKTLTKAQVLELYLNVIDYGYRQWGIGNAARFYFGKPPAELTDNQALILITMLPAPDWGNPLHSPKRFAAMRETSFRTLEFLKILTPEETEAIRNRRPVECLDEELQIRKTVPQEMAETMENTLCRTLRQTVRQNKRGESV